MNPRPLDDKVFGAELDRLRMLPRFPEVPAARQEMIRAIRYITQSRDFLHSLITYFVDHAETCPTARDLNDRARIMRSADQTRLASGPCAKCGGTGWIRGTRMVTASGMEPYEAEYSRKCECALGVAS